MKATRPDVRSAENEFNALNATILKTKCDPTLMKSKDALSLTLVQVFTLWDDQTCTRRHSMVRTDGQPLKLNTANRQIDSTSCVSIGSKSFKLPIEACVLENSPNVLSVRKLCNEGWSLNWNAHKTSTLTSPDGLIIHLKVRCFALRPIFR